VNLIGLLAWFDEPQDLLIRCVRALADAGVDHVVAVDGRYALYEANHDVSSAYEYAGILLVCKTLGMRCTIHQPSGPWTGGEVEKRTFLFTLAHAVAEPGDWFWVQDADQVATEWPTDLKDRLAGSEHDAAEVTMLDTIARRAQQKDWPERFVYRAMFRAQPITVGPSHCMYQAADGSLLWGYDGDKRMQAALDLSDCVLVEHRPDHRPHQRQHAKLMYYAQRDHERIERGRCELCNSAATSLQPCRWRWTDIGPVADWMECCDQHAEQVQAVNALELERMGIDPASVVAENRNGCAPDRSTV
jgi:hypothetical protein